MKVSLESVMASVFVPPIVLTDRVSRALVVMETMTIPHVWTRDSHVTIVCVAVHNCAWTICRYAKVTYAVQAVLCGKK